MAITMTYLHDHLLELRNEVRFLSTIFDHFRGYVNGHIDAIYNMMDEMQAQLNRIEATMVTKDEVREIVRDEVREIIHEEVRVVVKEEVALALKEALPQFVEEVKNALLGELKGMMCQ